MRNFSLYNLRSRSKSRRLAYRNSSSFVTTPKKPGIGVGAYNLLDLFASYKFDKTWTVRAGVTNLANHGPVFVSSSQNSTDAAVFDVVGRSYFVGVHMTL